MQIDIDPFAGVKKHFNKYKEAYLAGVLGFALGLLLRRRPIVIQNITQR